LVKQILRAYNQEHERDSSRHPDERPAKY
jgi:hypothetical protein